MKLRTCGTNVIINPEIAEKTPGGIWLPRNQLEMPSSGTIVALNDRVRKEFGLEVGMRVAYDKHYQELNRDQSQTRVLAENVQAILGPA